MSSGSLSAAEVSSASSPTQEEYMKIFCAPHDNSIISMQDRKDRASIGGRAEKVAPVMDGSTSGSREKSKKTLPASQSNLTCRAGETLSNLDGVFMRVDRILAAEERTIKDISKAEKVMRLKKDVQEHPDLTLVERLRMVDHLLAHEGQYYYWSNMDAEERVEFIKVFKEGKLE